MEEYAVWWVVMGALLAMELLTGSFYLLMLAIAAAIGAICSHLGFSLTWQWLISSLAGVVALLGCYVMRKHTQNNKEDVGSLDIGATVVVKNWREDGTAQVKYRGANWAAVTRNSRKNTGLHKVIAVEGNRLVVELN